jgi:sterol desaturase/sphingolipid hydroxylase (fatty acid hydroxylase superfamily)
MMLDRLVLVLGVMAALALLETLLPFRTHGRSRRDHLRANLGLTAAALVLNLALGALLAVGSEALVGSGVGLLARSHWPAPALLAITVVLLDLSAYAAHRLMHRSPAAWRVHRVHHADPLVDVTTSYRQHPAETLLRFVFIAAPAWALGLPAWAVAAYRSLSAVNALLEHANVRLWQPLDGLLSLVFVTPNMHKVHHSRRPVETDSNYGNILAIYDRLFGTFTPSARAGEIEYGLDGHDTADANGFSTLLRLPFRPEPPLVSSR